MSIKSINIAGVSAFTRPRFASTDEGRIDDEGKEPIVGTGPVDRRIVSWKCLQLSLGVALEPTFVTGFSATGYNDEISQNVQIRAYGPVGLPGWNDIGDLITPPRFDYNAKGQVIRPGDMLYLDFSRCAKGLWAAWDIFSLHTQTTPVGAKISKKGYLEDARQLVDILVTYQGSLLQGRTWLTRNSYDQNAHEYLPAELRGYQLELSSQEFPNRMQNRYTLHLQESMTVRLHTRKLIAENPDFAGLKPIGFANMVGTSAYFQNENDRTAAIAWTDSATGSEALGNRHLIATNSPDDIIPADRTDLYRQRLGDYFTFPEGWADMPYFDLQLPGCGYEYDGIRFYVQNGSDFYNMQISKKAEGEYYLHADDDNWLELPADVKPMLYNTYPKAEQPTVGQGTQTSPWLIEQDKRVQMSQKGFYSMPVTTGTTIRYSIEFVAEGVKTVLPDLTGSPSLALTAKFRTSSGAEIEPLPLAPAFIGTAVVPAGANHLLFDFWQQPRTNVPLSGSGGLAIGQLADDSQMPYVITIIVEVLD